MKKLLEGAIYVLSSIFGISIRLIAAYFLIECSWETIIGLYLVVFALSVLGFIPHSSQLRYLCEVDGSHVVTVLCIIKSICEVPFWALIFKIIYSVF